METILGLLGVLVFIVGVLALSSGVTWTVVKVTPQRAQKPDEPELREVEERLRESGE